MRTRQLDPTRRSALLVVLLAGGCTHTISTNQRTERPSASAAPAASRCARASAARIAVAPRRGNAEEPLIPDPSGLEYVRATVALTDVNTSTSRVFEARGWLSVDAQQPARRRLLTWGALWYPVIGVIGPADWRRDLSPTQRRSQHDPQQWQHELGFVEAGSSAELVLARRLGVAREQSAALEEQRAVDELARQLESQIEFAHARGDLEQQREVAARLAQLATARGSMQLLALARRWIDDARDALRRTAPTNADAPSAASATQRTRAIVAALDRVGGVHEISPAPLVEELERIGEAAIDVLLDTVEFDQRFTRRFYAGDRGVGVTRLLSVSELAAQTVSRILQPGCVHRAPLSSAPLRHDFSTPPTPESVAEFRLRWTAVRALSPLQRHLRAIEDDDADPAEWAAHIRALTLPARGACDRPAWATPREARVMVWRTAAGPMVARSLFDRRDRALTAQIGRRVLASVERAEAAPGDARLLDAAREITVAQLFWARSSAELRATRERWNTFSAPPDVRHAMLRAIDERARELAR